MKIVFIQAKDFRLRESLGLGNTEFCKGFGEVI